MNIHVIISTYNGSRWIEKCLKSIFASSIPVKVNLIDNASSDDTLDIVIRKFPSVDITPNYENIGFGRANNILLRKALDEGADFVFLINQDAWVDENAIEGLVQIHRHHPEYGIISPAHLNGSGTAFDTLFGIYCRHCPGLFSDLYLRSTKELYSINFVNGAFWLISRKCLLKTGLFDPIFPLYGEDLDFVARARAKGFKIGIAPAYRGFHDRDNRAVSLVHTKRIKKIKYIRVLKDTENSFPKALTKYLIQFNKNVFKPLFRLNLRSSYQEFKIGINVLSSINKILYSRRACSKPGAYLNG